MTLFAEACASCSPARRRCRVPSPPPDTALSGGRSERTGHREARGRSMQVRPGRAAFHDAILTALLRRFRFPRRSSSVGLLVRESRWHPCRLLRSLAFRIAIASSMRKLEGRQDRFRGGPVKDVRFCGPRCLPSPVAPQLPPVPKHERTPRLVHRSRGRSRDEDRPAPTLRSPFAPCGPCACAPGVFHPWLGSRPPASCLVRAFDPLAAEGALL
jgi:hypothetical protein